MSDVPEEEPVVLNPYTAPDARSAADESADLSTRRAGFRTLHLMYLVVICAFLIWIGMIVRLGMIPLFMLVVAAGVGFAIVLARRNATQQESLLWALAIAAERSLPLAPAALAFTDQYGASFRWKVRLFATLLNEGQSVPEAIDHVPHLFSREAEALVRTGWTAGMLAESLREAALLRSERKTAWAVAAFRFFYLGGVFLALQIISGFILYFIAPKFEAIFMDFGIRLPPVTLFTIRVSRLFVDYGLVTLLVVIAECFLLGSIPLGLFNVFQWDIPVLDRLYRRTHTALILKALALSIDGGKPVVSGIESLSEDYPSAWIRSRLTLVGRDVREGGNWIDSLRSRQLIGKADAAVIASSERVGNLAWALRETADSAERRIGYRFHFVLQTLYPLLVLAMGAFVLVFCVAYFSPIIQLIERLAG